MVGIMEAMHDPHVQIAQGGAVGWGLIAQATSAPLSTVLLGLGTAVLVPLGRLLVEKYFAYCEKKLEVERLRKELDELKSRVAKS